MICRPTKTASLLAPTRTVGRAGVPGASVEHKDRARRPDRVHRPARVWIARCGRALDGGGVVAGFVGPWDDQRPSLRGNTGTTHRASHAVEHAVWHARPAHILGCEIGQHPERGEAAHHVNLPQTERATRSVTTGQARLLPAGSGGKCGLWLTSLPNCLRIGPSECQPPIAAPGSLAKAVV